VPVLDITAEAIGPHRTRLALSRIENVMLWPHDERQRESAGSTALATWFSDNLPRTDFLTLEPTDAGDLMRWLTRTTPPDQVEEAAKQPFVRGIVAGIIFLQALEAKATRRNRNLQQIKADVREQLSSIAPFEKLASSTLETYVWGRYSPVVHFWGAFIRKGFDSVAAKTGAVFPCTLADLPDFLATSEAFRVAGEQCKLRSDRTLLDPSRTWRVPGGLPIPSFSLDWS
jgi:hypothetical protein